MKYLVYTTLVAQLMGCSATLKTTSTGTDAIPSGTPIPLPGSLLQVTQTYTLTGCKQEAPNQTPQITFDSEIDVVPLFFPAQYVHVDPKEASRFNNMMAVTAEYHNNGLTKSFSVKGEDKTVDIAASTIKGAINIVLASQGIPLIEIPKAEGYVPSKSPEVKCKHSDSSKAPVLTDTTILQFKEIAGAKHDFTPMDSSQFQQWFEGDISTIKGINLPNQKDAAFTVELLALGGAPNQDGDYPYNAQLKGITKTSNSMPQGVPIAMPGAGLLTVTSSDGKVTRSEMISLPELGHISFIGYSTRIGKDNELNILSSEHGTITKIEYKETKNEVSKGIDDISQAIASYESAKTAQDATEETKAQEQSSKLITAKVLAISMSYGIKQQHNLTDTEAASRVGILTSALSKIDLNNPQQLESIKSANNIIASNDTLSKALSNL
ncbi:MULTISPECIES: hypothetical protein [Vibrio]|uniref:hypothetical protein n=1 Tax=Vibrio TaxID=662 RepID=UPI001CDB68E9|nr:MULTISPECIES: hypothetical protein [Vibrio]MCA2483298.1 hypothetical protein [Vibrio alginolyticus]MDW2279603.1 hypothetical protein [Vibrio sp. 1402]